MGSADQTCNKLCLNNRAVAPKNAHIDEATTKMHDAIYHAYQKLGEIDARSIWYLQDQGAAELNISIITAQIKKELDRSGDIGDKTEDQLH